MAAPIPLPAPVTTTDAILGVWHATFCCVAEYGCYVALGDSFTEGLADAWPDGSPRGWADRVARHLAESSPGLRYSNLAVRGRRMQHVIADQLPAAERLRPTLVSLAIGGNDVVRATCDVPALGAAFDAVLSRLIGTGAQVVVFAGFDPRRRIPISQVAGRRAEQYNALIRSSAAERGAVLVDLWDLPRLYEERMWAPDRLHLSTDGHALVARAVLRALGEDPSSVGEPDAVVPPEPAWLAARARDLHWGAVHFTPWLVRGLRGRSTGDGIEPKHPLPVPPR